MPFIPDTPSDQSVPSSGGFTPDVGFAGQYRAASTPELEGILTQEQFEQQYQAAREGNVLQRVWDASTGPTPVAPLTLSGIYEDVVKPVAGIVPAKINQLIKNLTEKPALEVPAAELGSDIKTAVETARMLGTEALDIPSQTQQALEIAAERQRSNPIRNTLRLANPAFGNVLNALLPPEQASQAELNKAYEVYVQQESTKRAQARPEQQIIGDIIPGEANLDVAKGVKELVKLASPLIGAEERAATSALSKKIAASLKSPKEGLKNLTATLSARTAKATPEQQAQSAFGLDKVDAPQHMPVVIKHLDEVEGGLPKGRGAAERTVKLIDDAEGKAYQRREDVNQQASDRGLSVNFDEALSDAKAVLDADTITPQATKTAIFNELKGLYSGSATPQKGHTVQRQLNNKFKNDFAANKLSKSDLRFQTELAIRNNIANQMDELTKLITGVNDRPYAEIGSLIEVRGGLQSKIDALEAVESDIKTGFSGTVSPDVTRPKTAVVRELVKGPRSPLRASGMEILDKAVEGAFSGFKKAPAGGVLPAEGQAARTARFNRPASAVDDLEARIQETIKNLPPDIRKNNRLARMLAEMDVAGLSTPLGGL